MKLDTFIIGSLMVSLILIGGLMIMTENINTYDINITNKVFVNITNRTNEIFDDMDLLKEDLKPEGISSDSALNNLIGGAYNALAKVWQSVRLVGYLIFEIGLAIGIPAQILYIFTIFLMIAVVFGLIYMIFRFQPR